MDYQEKNIENRDMATSSSYPHLRFALVGNEYQSRKSASVPGIVDYLRGRGADVYIDSAYYEFLKREVKPDLWCTRVLEDGEIDADFVISLGGDGTFLK